MTSSPISRYSIARRRVLLLSGAGATVYRFSRGWVEDPLSFPADEVGVGGFAEYLRLSTPDPVYLMVDVVEEDFRLDTVPHVFGRDRQAVLENKRNRLFRDSRYSQSLFQGREPDGRRDDRVLFSSIIRPELLDPWLAQLSRLKVPLAGIYSLPVVSGELIKRIPVVSDTALLVSLQAGGGLRQTFFDQGHLKVSRLAAVPRLDPSRMASYVLQEVERVRRYLNSMRLLNRNVPLDVYVLAHGRLIDDIERQAKDTVTTQYQLVELEELARKLKVGGLTSGEQPYADRLFAYLLAREAPANFYASSRETRHHFLRRAGTAMTTLAALVLLGGVGWSLFEFARGFDRQLEIGTLARQADFYEARYDKGKELLPSLPADGSQIRRAVEMVDTVADYRETPSALMVTVSRALDEFPDLRVSALEWESAAEPNGATTGSRTAASRRGGRPREVGAPGYFQIGRLQGRIEPFDGDYRGALDRINRFVEVLELAEGVHSVTIPQGPLEISSRERLSGAAGGDESAEAAFEVRVVLRTHGDPVRG